MNLKQYIQLICLCFLTSGIMAQSDFKVGGVGRGNMMIASLEQKDTINPDAGYSGYTLLDLGIDGKLGKKVEINTIVRIYSEINAFFDESNSYIDIRQIQLKGRFNRHFKYEIGDLDFKMSKYTLWNEYEEGFSNESRIFSSFRDVARYENFNTDNVWRQQGAKVYGRYRFDSSNVVLRYKGLFSRLGVSDGVINPNEFMAGATAGLKMNDFDIELNGINFYNSPASIRSDIKTQNSVITSRLSYKMGDLNVYTEGGLSNLSQQGDTTSDFQIGGEFIEFGAEYKLSDKFQLNGAFRSVSDDFFSPGAQTKRIRYGQSPMLFGSVTNDQYLRDISVFDLLYDYSIYNKSIDRSLDVFNPKFGTATPYGTATPNRQGISIEASYGDTSTVVNVSLKPEFLRDVTGEGTDLQRTYLQTNAQVNVELSKLLNWNKEFDLDLGTFYTSSNRNDPNVSPVNLSSMILDAGLTLEVIKDYKLLVGYKSLTANGTDYLPIRDMTNSIVSFDQYQTDIQESIFGMGLRYDINSNVFLQCQYQMADVNDQLNNVEFGFNQFNVLFNLKF